MDGITKIASSLLTHRDLLLYGDVLNAKALIPTFGREQGAVQESSGSSPTTVAIELEQCTWSARELIFLFNDDALC